MIYKYSKVITYKDIASITQECDSGHDSRTLILELTDGGRLVFHRYNELKTDFYLYEDLVQSNLEYDEIVKVVEQYLQYSGLIQREGYMPFQARRLIEGEE